MDIHKFCHKCGTETGRESFKYDLCTKCYDTVFHKQTKED